MILPEGGRRGLHRVGASPEEGKRGLERGDGSRRRADGYTRRRGLKRESAWISWVQELPCRPEMLVGNLNLDGWVGGALPATPHAPHAEGSMGQTPEADISN